MRWGLVWAAALAGTTHAQLSIGIGAPASNSGTDAAPTTTTAAAPANTTGAAETATTAAAETTNTAAVETTNTATAQTTTTGTTAATTGTTDSAAATTNTAAASATSAVGGPLPSGVTATEGPYTITAMPAECTGDTGTYSTGFWVQNIGGFSVQDEAGLWGSTDPIAWTFSTNSTDIIFSQVFMASSPENPVTANYTNGTDNRSFTIYMSGADGGGDLEWVVASAADEPSMSGAIMSAFNGPSNASQATTQQRKRETDMYTYYLEISAGIPCAHPQGNSSCSSNDIDRTPDAWAAYGVDDFLSSWISNNSDSFSSSGGMFQKFVSDFGIGDGKSCTIENQCQLLEDCNQLPKNGTQENAPQVYLILIALQNLSDLFNHFYNSINIGQSDTMTQIAQLSMQFHYLNGTSTSTSPSTEALASGGLGLASSVLGLIPGLGDLTGFMGIVNSIMGLANTASSATSKFTFPDSQYAANQASISSYLGDYTGGMRNFLENSYTEMFADGTNLTIALKAGAAVNRTALNLDCDSCVSQSQVNFEQYLAFKMVNEMWWQQNAFITFMPYGTITQVDTNTNTTFDESDCASNFLTTDDDRLLTICHQTDGDDFGGFLGPGMARLNWYWPGDPDTRGVGNPSGTNGFLNMSRGPPGYKDFNTSNPVFDPSNGTATPFQVTDIIASSVAGWVQGGFNFDGVANAGEQIINQPFSQLTQEALAAMTTIEASTPGMFSIPVCVITDLNFWPTYWSTPNRVGGDYYAPCSNSKDRNGNLFTDYAAPELANIVNTVP